MKFSLLIICCLFSTGSFSANDTLGEIDNNMDEIWNQYKLDFQRLYSADEEAERRKNFELNHRMVQEHNAEADNGTHSYWLKINHLSDMSDEELSKSNCIREHGYDKITPIIGESSKLRASLPTTIDWRKKNVVTPVKSQGRCQACWAFAAVAALESHTTKKTGKMVTLSEQNLVDCAHNYSGDGCHGGTLLTGFDYVLNNKGINTEETYPYEEKDGQCRFSSENVGGTIKNYACIHRSEEYVKKIVATIGPVMTSVYSGDKRFKHYGHGLYSSDSCDKTVDHGLLIVGYGEEKGEKYWILKNSWSTKWGIDGYMYLKRDAPYMCGVAKKAAYPIL